MSTFLVYDMRRDTIGRLNAEMEKASIELSTGRHADIFEAAGSKSSRAFDIRGDLMRIEGFLVSNRLVEGRLEATRETLSLIREIAQDFLTLAAPSSGGPSATTGALQDDARRAFDRIADLSNTSYGGSRLLSGVASDQPALSGWAEQVAGTSPAAVVAGVLGAGLSNAGDAEMKADALDDIFADSVGLNGFSDVFYGGSAQGGPKLSAQVDTGMQLNYGVQADDEGFRDLMQGLAMFAAVDVSGIEDDAAYAAWIDRAVEKVSDGVSGILNLEVKTGSDQQQLASTISRQEGRRNLLEAERSNIEGVDPYDAALRLSELEARLEATYTVTARLRNLSFLNYI
ncbi:flagellin [Roseivivax sp. THAF40]|uniref:flagellin N-terminal helical domain-containing protein n=1 Tax=Roseivivax sp. THAF40 TaxID=2587858 RepID=UPI0015626E42|nr:flagellin [Roseivivax sp. THAF40]